MKNLSLLLGLALTFLTVSCDDALEEEVFDSVTPANFFQTEADVEVGVLGVYDGLQNNSYWYRQFMTEALPGSVGHFWNETFNSLNYNNSTGNLWIMWEQSYNIIANANAVIPVIETSSLEEDVKNGYLAEVRYLRALVYFNMVRWYGQMPLVTTVPETIDEATVPQEGADESVFESQFLKQVDREDIYTFIIEELQWAEANLAEATFSGGVDNGRARKGAATALLAKVYLTQAGYQYNYSSGGLEQGDGSKWAMAAQKTQELIDNSPYSLEPNFEDIFKNENDNNEEVIFSIQYLESAITGVTSEGGQTVARFGIRGSDITPFSWKQAFSNLSFYESWVDANGEDDKRLNTTYLRSYIDGDGNEVTYGGGNFIRPHLWKFVSDVDVSDISALNATDYGDNPIYMRYADVLLMNSEALNEAGGTPAAETLYGINAVRVRAGQPEITLPISKEDLREAIWKERKWELCYEGHYFFDSQRTGRLLDEIALNWDESGGTVRAFPLDVIDEKYYILPIHFNAISANPSLDQNAGW
ncbi:RagB/SusD family nutrient uptake outer membrane protein [Maribacter dokdonensis]|uniref:RagB/SusD family nutrient uptake outer membrane protein n=1 Tax=Maribacter dokdonensis TaxID=320912 RepID=UPI0032985CF0